MILPEAMTVVACGVELTRSGVGYRFQIRWEHELDADTRLRIGFEAWNVTSKRTLWRGYIASRDGEDASTGRFADCRRAVEELEQLVRRLRLATAKLPTNGGAS